jgi:hypothetical protein
MLYLYFFLAGTYHKLAISVFVRRYQIRNVKKNFLWKKMKKIVKYEGYYMDEKEANLLKSERK